jgi:hypothetical protein
MFWLLNINPILLQNSGHKFLQIQINLRKKWPSHCFRGSRQDLKIFENYGRVSENGGPYEQTTTLFLSVEVRITKIVPTNYFLRVTDFSFTTYTHS